MAKAREKSKKRPWLRYVLLLCCGGGSGVGGVVFKDHPILQRLFYKAVGHDEKDGQLTGKEAIQKVVGAVVKVEAYRNPGEFELKLTDLKLDQTRFKRGSTLDVQVRLLKVDANGREASVWDSRTAGENPVSVGSGEVSTDWSDVPFVVSWKPGEDFVLEVWDRKSLFNKKYFTWKSDDKKIFPLKSGSYTLASMDRGGATESKFVIEAKPKATAAEIAKDIEADIRIK